MNSIWKKKTMVLSSMRAKFFLSIMVSISSLLTETPTTPILEPSPSTKTIVWRSILKPVIPIILLTFLITTSPSIPPVWIKRFLSPARRSSTTSPTPYLIPPITMVVMPSRIVILDKKASAITLFLTSLMPKTRRWSCSMTIIFLLLPSRVKQSVPRSWPLD